MKKNLPKDKIRCGACKIILLKKELYEHLKSEEHLKKADEIKKAYEVSLERLMNQDK